MEKGGTILSNELYQKTGIAVNYLAQDLLARKKGDRIPSISEYQEKLGVSRGTIQNGLNYLKERQAVILMSRGHMGTFIEFLDYRRLQECGFNKEILGSMPLPYSLCYQGLATALFQLMSPYAFNLVYARGSGSRMKLLASGMCQTFLKTHRLNHQDFLTAILSIRFVTWNKRHCLNRSCKFYILYFQ